MARVAECNKVLGVIVGGDVSASLLHARAVDVVDDQARTIATADATLESVTLKDAICGRFSPAFCFVKASIQKTGSAVFSVWRSRSFATCFAKTLCFPFFTNASIVLARALEASRTLGLAFNRRALATQGAEPLSLESVEPAFVPSVSLLSTLGTADILGRYPCLATAHAGAFSFLSMVPRTLARRARICTGLATIGPRQRRLFSTGQAQQLPFETKLSLLVDRILLIMTGLAASKWERGRNMTTANAKTLRFQLVALFLGIAHGYPPAGDCNDYTTWARATQ